MVITGSSSTPARLDTVTIECNVTANPPARIMWMKMGTTSAIIQTLINTRQTSIIDQLSYTPSGPLSRSTLTINNVEASDNGNYICEASSGPSPPSVSANFTICVIGKCQPTLNCTMQLACRLMNNNYCHINYNSSGISLHNTSQSSDNSIWKSRAYLLRMSNTHSNVYMEFYSKGSSRNGNISKSKSITIFPIHYKKRRKEPSSHHRRCSVETCGSVQVYYTH